MEKDIILDTAQIFQTHEKWETFLELIRRKEAIIALWNEKLIKCLSDKFNNSPMEGWTFKNIGNKNIDCRWFLKDYDENSLCIVWELPLNGRLSIWTGNCNKEIINNLLDNDQRFRPLFEAFEMEPTRERSNYQLWEQGNFQFNTTYDYKISTESLYWFAGNKTEEFAQQLFMKIENIMKCKDLFRELNELAKPVN